MEDEVKNKIMAAVEAHLANDPLGFDNAIMSAFATKVVGALDDEKKNVAAQLFEPDEDE